MAHVETDLGFKWDVLEDLDEFKALKEFIKGATRNYRQILSYHTTIACQPQKSPGASTSLKASGLDEMKGESGKYYVEVTLEDSYDPGDGLKVPYTGARMANFKDCKNEAVVDLLALLLANRPCCVRIHQNSIIPDIKEVRQCADKVYLAARVAAGFDAGTSDATRFLQPRELPEARSRRLKSPPESVPDDAKEILVEFLKTLDGELYPNNLRKPVRDKFTKYLAAGQLKDFLKTLPAIVEVLERVGNNGDLS
jgi:hypothetical protein